MSPDVIFLISDASFQWKEEGPLSGVLGRKFDDAGLLRGKTGCVLNFVGFEMRPEDKREISSIARDIGGKIREIE